VNFGDEPATGVDVAGTVEVSSDGAGEGSAFPFCLAPETAVVLATAG
jgi:hypothetical protein